MQFSRRVSHKKALRIKKSPALALVQIFGSMIVIPQSANGSVSAPVHRFWAAGSFRRAERLQKLKSVARRNRTAVPSGAEPLHALLRTAVCKRVRTDVPGGHFLQAIVAHG
jgi:hypothetical protein